MNEDFAYMVLEIVREIPKGKVASYSQIAALSLSLIHISFSNSEHREKIIDEMLETGNLEYVSETYPFINNELKNRLLTYFIENRMTEELSELMDFM